jgi:hypothetical protein
MKRGTKDRDIIIHWSITYKSRYSYHRILDYYRDRGGFFTGDTNRVKRALFVNKLMNKYEKRRQLQLYVVQYTQ